VKVFLRIIIFGHIILYVTSCDAFDPEYRCSCCQVIILYKFAGISIIWWICCFTVSEFC